ncbi:hypothetical protein IMG5_173450 [Ichthyophthirius multifiliis]|uniref:DUF4201 domain-containing protein n=1 Tax=Ichthyophthirius multifiliis TaxID=5932 RepID=G0R1X6_ICHMU|nr:hypothetical protein IMG5_173450 [Ichthyophthirius multifiliis]EGR28528.1 hypothetical protein IMG5_173450 [Ichthyophthirius multifiliis]|eukprot:XP_004029764.1 hypothetical protein IMG5_173450 [Ichthyophthirius multifiliis]
MNLNKILIYKQTNKNKYKNLIINQANHKQQFIKQKIHLQLNKQKDIYEIDEQFLKKAKKAILKNINDIRQQKNLQIFEVDGLYNIINQQYSQFLLNNKQDNNFYELMQIYIYTYLFQQKNRKQKNQILQDSQLCFISAQYEQEQVLSEQYIYNYIIELGYLFLESEQDRVHLLSNNNNIYKQQYKYKIIYIDPQNNSIGIGVSCDEQTVSIVLTVCENSIVYTRICKPQLNTIEIRGKVLDQSLGIYAIKVHNLEKNQDIQVIGPEFIEFNKQKQEFKSIFQLQKEEFNNQNLVDLYMRIMPDSITYMNNQGNSENIQFKHLQIKQRMPVIVFPDLEDQEEEDMLERQKIEEEIRFQEETININNKNKYKLYQQFFIYLFISLYIQQEIRNELEISIQDASRQHFEFLQHNEKLQEEIKKLKQKNNVYVEQSSEIVMNEHKYLNTLGHVHQIRLDLKQIQEKYNKMCMELQQQLIIKQNKCNEIKEAFQELKLEVGRKAINFKTNKILDEKVLEDLKIRENQKSKEIQELRLIILKLRNSYLKNQKSLLQKDEIAQDLHLIDFEQLKIENQTLNQKIQERNEELNKLKKKNNESIQILTHTREKMLYISQKNDMVYDQKVKINKELDDFRQRFKAIKITKEENYKIIQNQNKKQGKFQIIFFIYLIIQQINIYIYIYIFIQIYIQYCKF